MYGVDELQGICMKVLIGNCYMCNNSLHILKEDAENHLKYLVKSINKSLPANYVWNHRIYQKCEACLYVNTISVDAEFFKKALGLINKINYLPKSLKKVKKEVS